MKKFHFLLLLILILASSCTTKRQAYYASNSIWRTYEAKMDSAKTCDELNAAYVNFCRTVANPNTVMNETEWEYLRTAIHIIDRKMSRRTYQLCGMRTPRQSDWWNEDYDFYQHEDGEDPEEYRDDYDFYDDYQFGFDYDEFDSDAGR